MCNLNTTTTSGAESSCKNQMEQLEQSQTTKVTKEKKKKNWFFSFIKENIPFVLIAIFLVVLFKLFFFNNVIVPTGSMLNTIQLKDHLIVSVIGFNLHGVDRGDIISFRCKADNNMLYVKRVIGLPGDTINIVDGQVYLNDATEPLVEDYVTNEKPEGNFGPYVIPEDDVFVMGDNRNHSYDSRYWGTVNMDDIKGKVILRYFPTIEKID